MIFRFPSARLRRLLAGGVADPVVSLGRRDRWVDDAENVAGRGQHIARWPAGQPAQPERLFPGRDVILLRSDRV